MKRELALAACLAIAIGLLTVAEVPPVSAVMSLGERASAGWSVEGAEPPVPHAEILSLERLAATVQVPLESMLDNLEAAGVEGADRQTTIAALASSQDMTPEEIWVALTGKETPAEIPAGGAYGRKTVGEVCVQLDIPPEEGLARLRRNGMEATRDTPMKSLAERHGRRPHDLLQILAGA